MYKPITTTGCVFYDTPTERRKLINEIKDEYNGKVKIEADNGMIYYSQVALENNFCDLHKLKKQHRNSAFLI